MGGAIDAADAEESKLGLSWCLCQTLEKPIIRLVLKRRNSCITHVSNVRVALGPSKKEDIVLIIAEIKTC